MRPPFVFIAINELYMYQAQAVSMSHSNTLTFLTLLDNRINN